jgi:hypothetical protein
MKDIKVILKFIGLKVVEVVGVFIIGYLLYLLGNWNPLEGASYPDSIIGQIVVGLGTAIVGLLCLFIIFLIGSIFLYIILIWIKKNWEWANEKWL